MNLSQRAFPPGSRRLSLFAVSLSIALVCMQRAQAQFWECSVISTNFNDVDWAPDGSRLAVSRGNGTIWTLFTDGSSPVQITAPPAGRISWSPVYRPNSTQLYYLDNVDNFHWLIATEVAGGGGRNKLLQVPGGDTFSSVSFSPDGRQFAYLHNVDYYYPILKIANADGTGVRTVWDDDSLRSVSWGRGANSNRLAVAKTESGSSAVFVVNADGSGLVRVTPSELGECFNPHWSPDGAQLVFSRRSVGETNQQIWVINADGSDAQAVTGDGYDNVSPKFSPDGNRIAYISIRGGIGHVCMAARVQAQASDYYVIDLSGGINATNYPVTRLSGVPAGGWTDEYKTTKLVLKNIPAGTFVMGSPTNEVGRNANVDATQHTVTLSRAFCIGVFEVSQRQWELVMGNRPSYFTNLAYYAARPVEQVAYDEIRGSSDGAGWPGSSAVDAASFMGVLRMKTGLWSFDLPTEAQWEYSCRAETVTALNSGKNLTNALSDASVAEVGRYIMNGGGGNDANGDTSLRTATVGSYRPNAWGLYDMHGNVLEWCLDWFGTYEVLPSEDPRGAVDGTARVMRGGSWMSFAGQCASAARDGYDVQLREKIIGFRVASVLLRRLTVVGGAGGGIYEEGFPAAVAAAAPQPGQAFVRWTVIPEDADLGGAFTESQTATTVVMPAHDVTLTATYGAVRTVTFDAQGGSVSPASQPVTVGRTYGELPEPVRTGFAFAGWYTAVNGGGGLITKDSIFTSDVNQTLYAKWRVPVAYYADASRPDDTGNGLSWATACKSIQAAIDKAVAGDTVWVTNGVYNVGIGNTSSGNSRIGITNNVSVRSVNGASVTVIRGSGTETYGSADAVRCVYLSVGCLDGFTLEDGATMSGTSGGGVSANRTNVAKAHVLNCVIRNCKAGSGGGSIGGTLMSCNIEGNVAASNIGGGACEGLLINCRVFGNASTTCGGGTSHSRLMSCTVVGNRTAGCPGGGCYLGSITNSVVWGNLVGSTATNNWSGSKVGYSCTKPSASGVGNITVDPLFTDPANGDFRLLPGSPCIDKGSNELNTVAVDIDGRQRVMDGDGDGVATIDMGAFEFAQGITCTVTFDAQGGTVAPAVRTVTQAMPYGELPTPVLTNHTFHGWYTASNGGGVRITAGSIVSSAVNHTLYAGWVVGTRPGADYMVIDLSGGEAATGYPVHYLEAVPVGGWSDDYLTSKLVLRKVSRGTFTMGSPTSEVGRYDIEVPHEVTLAKDYYIGLFEVTQRQWELVMGGRPSYYTNLAHYASRPVEMVSYSDIRGASLGAGWPGSRDVDATSFMGKLRAKAGLALIDLPTGAQWEYACRAGTSTALNSGLDLSGIDECPNLASLGRYRFNGYGDHAGVDTRTGTAKVGSYAPNAWGLYDLHGNVWEWCLDWYGPYAGRAEEDPSGPASGTYRLRRGGSWYDVARECRSAQMLYWHNIQNNAIGFRVASGLQGDLTVTFDAQGGSVSPAMRTATYGEPYGPLPAPVRPGYAFEGWYTGVNGAGTLITESATVNRAANQTLYAKWRRSVTFHVNGFRPNDTGDGLSWATACKSIQTAIDKAAAGDIVLVTNGIYKTGIGHGDLYAGYSRIGITNNITVKSVNGAGVTFIQGSGFVPDDIDGAVRCAKMNAGRLEGFTLEGGCAYDADVNRAIDASAFGGGVSADSGAVIAACVIRDCSAEMGGGSCGGTLVNCVLTRNSAYMGGGSFDGTLVNCTLADNTVADSGGLVLDRSAALKPVVDPYGGGAYGCTLDNCIVWGNRTSSGAADNHAECLMAYSCSSPLPEGSGNREADPFFVDASRSDYRLQRLSPCVDQGYNGISSAMEDIRGLARVADGDGDGTVTIDMGAYEYAGGATYTVTFDAQGGTVSPATKLVTRGEAYGSLPVAMRTGYQQAGWYTAANGGGAFIVASTTVASTANHKLYAKWVAIPKLTVNGGWIEGEDSNIAFVAPGQERQVVANDVDGKVFEKWTVAPASANLGVLFNPREAYATVVMPLSGVTLTAVYVTAPGFITVEVSGNITDVELGGISWSVDNVAWVPVNDGNSYPLKPGTYAVSFKSASLNWLAPAKQTVKVFFDQTTSVNAVATYVPVVAWRLSADSLPGSGTVTLSPANGQVLPGKSVKLTAKAANNFVFVGWESPEGVPAGAERSPALTVAPERDSVYTARFRAKGDCEPPEIRLDASTWCMVGAAYHAVLGINDGALPVKFTATALPAGLKLDPVTGVITGVPTRAGTFSVTFSASGAGGAAVPQTLVFTVASLPVWAQGVFNGWAYLQFFASGRASTATNYPGTASMSVSAAGKISGKVTCGGTNYIFTAASYEPVEEGFDVLRFTADAKAGKVSLPLAFSVFQMAPDSETLATLSGARCGYLGENASCDVFMDRNAWKDPGMAAVATNYTGYYTASLTGGEGYGSGYLAFTVDKVGGVKTAGKLADGTAVSQSGMLGMDGGGTVITVVYAAPTAYKGGSFFGLVEFVKPEEGGPVIVRMLDDQDIQGAFLWNNYNPAATGEYGEGFSRSTDLYGGWYNKLINLRDYYENGLTVGGIELPALTAAVTYTDWNDTGMRRITWTEYGVFEAAAGASPLWLGMGITPAAGVGTGLSVPRADTPAFIGAGEYDYEVDTTGDGVSNTSGLSLTFTRATGLFRGSFKTWYDYVSAEDYTTGRVTYMHAQKTVSYEGVLAPVREDGYLAEGSGFFLWADTGAYESGRFDIYGDPIMVPYTFKRSYNFLLMGD